MKSLLLPILPKMVDRILSGKQRYLFRRTQPRQPFTRVLCAVKEPMPTVVLELLTGTIHVETLNEMHRLFYRFSGMFPTEWAAYWFDAKEGVAIEIQNAVLVPPSKHFNPVQYYRLNQFPQNYCYVPAPTWPLGHPYTRAHAEQDSLFNTTEGAA